MDGFLHRVTNSHVSEHENGQYSYQVMVTDLDPNSYSKSGYVWLPKEDVVQLSDGYFDLYIRQEKYQLGVKNKITGKYEYFVIAKKYLYDEFVYHMKKYYNYALVHKKAILESKFDGMYRLLMDIPSSLATTYNTTNCLITINKSQIKAYDGDSHLMITFGNLKENDSVIVNIHPDTDSEWVKHEMPVKQFLKEAKETQDKKFNN